LTALVFSLVALILLIGYGILAGGIHQTPAVWAAIIVRLVVGSLPFIALGFAIGYWSGPNAAPALANLIYLPLSFASGLFVPLNQLPAFIQHLPPYLPTHHYPHPPPRRAIPPRSSRGTRSAPGGSRWA